MKFLPLLFLCTCLLWLTGCDKTISYYFQVKNISEEKIKIEYAVSDIDTTIFVEKNKIVQLYKDSRLGDPTDFVGEEMYLFSSIKIYNKDSVLTNKDCYKREFWNFSKTDTEGTYLLEITDEDFN